MKIKDRFTVFENTVTEKTVVLDNKDDRILSLMEADIICQNEYGKHFSAKTEYISKVIDSVISSMKYYNNICEEGFEITVNDIVNKFKQDEKRT